MEKNKIETQVTTLLKEYGYLFDKDDYVDIVDFVQHFGFIVGNAQLCDGEDGFLAIQASNMAKDEADISNDKIIGVNSKRSLDWKRFIIAHEFAHSVLHYKTGEIYLHRENKKGKDDEENDADYFDMYPLYWTPSRGGIIMRYTYEYKRKCVELYREGKWPETPEGVSDKSFRDKVRLWVRAEDSRGPEALKHKNFNRNWTPEERLELVSQVMSGKSCVSVAIEAGIQDRLLYQWVQNYKTKGYNGLVEMKKGRPSKGVPQMKKEEARPLNESEREELIRLRAENEYIKAENEVIKKEIALREERHAAQLKARKQRSSKSCVKKDTN